MRGKQLLRSCDIHQSPIYQNCASRARLSCSNTLRLWGFRWKTVNVDSINRLERRRRRDFYTGSCKHKVLWSSAKQKNFLHRARVLVLRSTSFCLAGLDVRLVLPPDVCWNCLMCHCVTHEGFWTSSVKKTACAALCSQPSAKTYPVLHLLHARKKQALQRHLLVSK